MHSSKAILANWVNTPSSWKQSKIPYSKKYLNAFSVSSAETSHPPISITSCCESIIGCQKCTSTWLNAGKDTCPKCRKEGFSNMLITMKGFDEFLNKMHWFDCMLTTKVTLYIHIGIKKWIYYMNSTTACIIHCIKFLFQLNSSVMFRYFITAVQKGASWRLTSFPYINSKFISSLKRCSLSCCSCEFVANGSIPKTGNLVILPPSCS